MAPSAKLALYLAAVVAAYLIRNPAAVLVYAATVIVASLAVVAASGARIPTARWRVIGVFITWVLLMRAALEVVTGVHFLDRGLWMIAGAQAARVAVLGIGVLALVAITTPRQIVDELERSRLPRWVRLLVMMLIQYPRVLRERYEQIVEAQVARGAERAKSLVQRVGYGARVLLPTMQSELNAVGERAALMHVRRADFDPRPTATPRVALAFKNFGFTYAGADRPAVEGVDLEIPAGKVTVLVSAQGKGKTTLLRAAAGLLGEVYGGEFHGSVEGAGDAAAFFDGYVQVTLTVETVREEIALPLYATHGDAAERDARAIAAARAMAIEKLLDRRVTELSGGEEKLVGIAAAFAVPAPLCILDEPFEQLDVGHLAAVIRSVKRRARAGDVVLVATGSLDIALNVADAAVFHDGSRWRYVDAPTLRDLASAPGLAGSTVSEFAAVHAVPPDAVRRFRDAVRLAS